MHDTPREKLRQLILRFGPDVGLDARRCEALLRDVCSSSFKREIFALSNAVKEGVPAEIQSTSPVVPRDVLFTRCAARLHDNLGISPELCRWTVETWAYALGTVSKSEVTPDVRCPQCDSSIKIPPKLFGKSAKCPKCSERLFIAIDGRSVQVRHEDQNISAQNSGSSEIDASEVQIDPSANESAEDLFRQVINRMIASKGTISKADRMQLERSRIALGVSSQVAAQIVNQFIEQVSKYPPNFGPSVNSEPKSNAPIHSEPLQSNAWFVTTSNGSQYGPMDHNTALRCVHEGRISSHDFLWCEGSVHWRPAASIFPQLNSPSKYFGEAQPNAPSPPIPSQPVITETVSPPIVETLLSSEADQLLWTAVASLPLSFCCWPIGTAVSIVALHMGFGLLKKTRYAADGSEVNSKVKGAMTCAWLGLALSLFFLGMLVVQVISNSQ